MGSAEKQGELWSREAEDWSEIQEPMHKPLWDAMLSIGRVGSGSRLLDVGCGGGGASVLGLQRGAQVGGLDASADLLEIARSRVPEGDFRQGDMDTLPFPDDSFDTVIASNSVQYSTDRVATLQEMGRVCTAGGRIVVGLWAAPELVEFRAIFKAMRDALPEPPPGKGPFELSGPGVLDALLESAELRVEGSGEARCPFIYPSFEIFWRAIKSAGPAQAAMQQVSAEELSSLLKAAVEPFRRQDGSIQFENSFQYCVAVV